MTMRDTDRALVQAARAVAKLRCRSAAHTLAAAARTVDGRIVSGVNVVHPTGGACAEVVVVGTAATQNAGEVETIVTVGDRGRLLVAPCDPCRRLLAEHFPALRVIVGPVEAPQVVPLTEVPTVVDVP
ncbi:cytidine/deoxycytidylate deaminase family protein [Micromonospora craniellae]|uniref:Cytidine deaminase n=1 Tax=Micromonospora craniellae TaxID=2294034 RepID=A0A372G1S9_9ACTN|nr:cytidine deaminase [Micromonospora craniellae]QOC92729.1 cytidine deaminase [Micromonospora craniellae]RFS46972.1 cytidine deaminase [Micromonospora craniellae]